MPNSDKPRLDLAFVLISATLVLASLSVVSSVLADDATETLPTEVDVSAEHPDFSGDWVLNDKLSDDPREKMRELLKSQRGRGGRGGRGRGGGFGAGGGGAGGRGGFGGGGQGGPGGRRGGRGGEDGPPGGPMQAPPKEIQISHDEPLIILRHGVGPLAVEQLTRTNGTRFQRQTPRGEIEATASWDQAGRLEVHLGKDDSGPTETWELVADGERLFITQEFGPDKDKRVQIRRVYDRVDETESM